MGRFLPLATIHRKNVPMRLSSWCFTTGIIGLAVAASLAMQSQGAFAKETASDQESLPQINIAGAFVKEGAGHVAFVVTLSAPSAEDVAFDFATEEPASRFVQPCSIAGEDYVAVSKVVTIPTRARTVQVAVNVVDDGLWEWPIEFFAARITNVRGAIPGKTRAICGVWDNDPPPKVSVDDVSAPEGGRAYFSVRLSAVPGRPVLVHLQTLPGRERSADPAKDYGQSRSKWLVIPTMRPSATAEVQTIPDKEAEGNETLILKAKGPVNEAAGTATIVDRVDLAKDLRAVAAWPVISMKPVPRRLKNGATLENEIIEGETKAIRIALSKASKESVRVWYGLSALGEARPGKDYQTALPADGRITFKPGETEKTIHVTTLDNQESQTSITGGVRVFLVRANYARIGDESVEFYISDDDTQPELRPLRSDVRDGDVHGFAVTLSRRYREPVSVEYETREDTAKAGKHFRPTRGKVVFPPWATRIDVPVETIDTGLAPGEVKELRMIYKNATNATLKETEVIGTIHHNPDRGKDSSQR